MADDKLKTGRQDRDRVAKEQQYELSFFARKHGLSQTQAREIIIAAGSSRERADQLAEQAK